MGATKEFLNAKKDGQFLSDIEYPRLLAYFHEDGFCRYPMVRERTPEMADDGQCLGYVFSDSF